MNAARNSTIRSIVYSLLASLAIAVAIFPTATENPGGPVDPFRAALWRARERYIVQVELLRRMHSRELARAAIEHSAGMREVVADVRPSDVPLVVQERVHNTFGRTLKLARLDPNMRVVIAYTLDTGVTVAGAPTGRYYRGIRIDVFPPGAIADGVCSIVARVTEPALLGAMQKGERTIRYISNTSDVGSACGWYAAYGTPGRGVARWLDSTHFEPINSRVRGISFGYQRTGMEQPINFVDPEITACWAERDNACEALVLQPQRASYNDWSRPALDTPGWIGGYLWHDARYNGFSTAMLVGLEHDLGAEGFAAFWKSNDPLPVAFATARGESLESWARLHFRRGAKPYTAGPLPDQRISLAWLLAVPGLLALGVLAVAKRQSFA